MRGDSLRVPVALAAVIAAVVGVSRGGGGSSEAQDAAAAVRPAASDVRPAAASPYSRLPTIACLKRRGATVADIGTNDPGLRGLRDLAQRRSVVVRFRDNARVGVAFLPNVAGAELLVELLTVPRAQYAVTSRGNVVIQYRNRDADALSSVVGCLKP